MCPRVILLGMAREGYKGTGSPTKQPYLPIRDVSHLKEHESLSVVSMCLLAAPLHPI
jgi:hypothetical protein